MWTSLTELRPCPFSLQANACSFCCCLFWTRSVLLFCNGLFGGLDVWRNKKGYLVSLAILLYWDCILLFSIVFCFYLSCITYPLSTFSPLSFTRRPTLHGRHCYCSLSFLSFSFFFSSVGVRDCVGVLPGTTCFPPSIVPLPLSAAALQRSKSCRVCGCRQGCGSDQSNRA